MNQVEISLPADMLARLRPHEQRLVMRQMSQEQVGSSANGHNPVRLSNGLGGVFAQASQLCAAQTNWEMTPREPVLCETCKDKGYLMPKLTPRNQLNRRAYPCPDCYERQQERYCNYPLTGDIMGIRISPLSSF